MRQSPKQRTLAEAVPILERVHRAVGELLNESLDDLRRLEKDEARRVGVPYSMHPRLIVKFENVLGRKLRDGAELRDVKDTHFFIGNVLALLRTLTG